MMELKQIEDTIKALEGIRLLKHVMKTLEGTEDDCANKLSGMIYILELKYLPKSEDGNGS